MRELEELAVGVIQVRRRLLFTGPVFRQPLLFAAAHGQTQGADLGGEHHPAEQLFRYGQDHGARSDPALILFEFVVGAEGRIGGLAVVGQAVLFTHAKHAHGRYDDLRRLLQIARVLAQVEQHIDIVAGEQLPGSADHFIHGHRQSALVAVDHPRQ